MKVSFKATIDEMTIINDIVSRADAMYKKATGSRLDKTSASMDITACHANGCPLRLAEMLAADDANFGHDFFGISRHIDRNTGKLGGCFLPRFAK